MRAMNQDTPGTGAIRLELNPRHPLIKNLNKLRTTDGELAKEVGEQIYDNAMVAAGFIEDPREMIGRLYKMLERLTEKEVG